LQGEWGSDGATEREGGRRTLLHDYVPQRVEKGIEGEGLREGEGGEE
jgi:hypothetical protein